MDGLIQVRTEIIGGGEVNAIDARELYEFLGSKQEFASWIKGRINKYDFVEGVDFIIFDNHTSPGGRPKKEFTFTTPAALMLVQAEKGIKAMAAHKVIAESIDGFDKILKALREFEVPDDIPDMFVYAIRDTKTGYVKIGISKHPSERLHQLQVANPNNLELVACHKAKNRFKDEAVQHKLNSEYHERGEWYKPGAYLQGVN